MPLPEYFAHGKHTNTNFIQRSSLTPFKADMHIFKSKSVILGRKTGELNFKCESYRLILIKIRPNLITEHKPAFWKETPCIQLLFFTTQEKNTCYSMTSALTSMRQWKKVLAREVDEESLSSNQWQNTGAHSQQGFIKLARGCLWFSAAEVCLSFLHLRGTIPSALKFSLF